MTAIPRIVLGAACLATLAGCGAPDPNGLFEPTRNGGSAGRVTDAAAPATSSGAGGTGSPVASPVGPSAVDVEVLAGSPSPLPSAPGAGLPPSGNVEAEPDASAPAAPEPDAGVEAPPVDVEPPCAGALLGDDCWYLGADGHSCDEACTEHGGVSDAALAVVGSSAQGGSIEGCTAVLRALGVLITPVTGVRDDGLGFGCHLYSPLEGAVEAWWLGSPDFSATMASVQMRLSCACAR